MANFFPAGSRTDVERTSSFNRRTQSRGVSRESGDDSSSDSRQSRPSHINWLPSPSATTQQARPSMPRRPPSVQLARSASLSALAGASPTLRRQSSLISNHSLQLDRPAASATVNPTVKQLSPISERSYVSTPKREQCFTDVEPSTPVSVGKPKRGLRFRRVRVSRILLHTRRFFVFRLLAATPEAIDLCNLNELPSHKRNIPQSAYPPALESLAARASPSVPSSVPQSGPTTRLDRLRRRGLGTHRQLRHCALRLSHRRGRHRGVAVRPRSLALHNSLLTNRRAVWQPIRSARRPRPNHRRHHYTAWWRWRRRLFRRCQQQ